jgi:hypothetical protein
VSTYLCGRCNKYGEHVVNVCRKRGNKVNETYVPRHYCCPAGCELDNREEIEHWIQTWTKAGVAEFIAEEQHKLDFLDLVEE